MTDSFEDISIGIVGTGSMATAHAYRWSLEGIKVFVGSRNAAKGRQLAQRVGNGCQGGEHLDMIRASNFIILAIYPGATTADFIDKYREELVGTGKMLVDLSVPFSRLGYPRAGPEVRQFIHPHLDHVNFIKAKLNDPTASVVKAWANLMASSIANNRRQPVGVAGDPAAKAVAIRLLHRAGFEFLDCGGPEDVAKIEPGFHERRWKHPRHLQFNGPNHP
jgi:predicted dinucleotide-binding enzyme